MILLLFLILFVVFLILLLLCACKVSPDTAVDDVIRNFYVKCACWIESFLFLFPSHILLFWFFCWANERCLYLSFNVCLLNCYCVKPWTYHKALSVSESLPLQLENGTPLMMMMTAMTMMMVVVAICIYKYLCVATPIVFQSSVCMVYSVFDVVSTVDDVYVFQRNNRAHYHNFFCTHHMNI